MCLLYFFRGDFLSKNCNENKQQDRNEQHLTVMFQKFLFSSRLLLLLKLLFFLLVFVIVVVSCFFFGIGQTILQVQVFFSPQVNDLNELKDKAEKANPLTNG